MTYVVTDACIRCKYIGFVEVCPVNFFYEGENTARHQSQRMHGLRRLRPECRRSHPSDTESSLEKWLEVNATSSTEWPNITRKKDSPADADEHKGEEGKFDKSFTAAPGEGD